MHETLTGNVRKIRNPQSNDLWTCWESGLLSTDRDGNATGECDHTTTSRGDEIKTKIMHKNSLSASDTMESVEYYNVSGEIAPFKSISPSGGAQRGNIQRGVNRCWFCV